MTFIRTPQKIKTIIILIGLLIIYFTIMLKKPTVQYDFIFKTNKIIIIKFKPLFYTNIYTLKSTN